MKVRAKFAVESKDTGTCGQVLMRPVYSQDPNHENKAFWDATPAGTIQMWINNPEAFAQFNVGDEIYVDFTAAPKDLTVENCASCGKFHTRLKRHKTEEGEHAFCPETGSKLFITENE